MIRGVLLQKRSLTGTERGARCYFRKLADIYTGGYIVADDFSLHVLFLSDRDNIGIRIALTKMTGCAVPRTSVSICNNGLQLYDLLVRLDTPL